MIWKRKRKIIFACYILHDYLVDVDLDDIILVQVDNRLWDEAQKEHHNSGRIIKKPYIQEDQIIRDTITFKM